MLASYSATRHLSHLLLELLSGFWERLVRSHWNSWCVISLLLASQLVWRWLARSCNSLPSSEIHGASALQGEGCAASQTKSTHQGPQRGCSWHGRGLGSVSPCQGSRVKRGPWRSRGSLSGLHERCEYQVSRRRRN